MTKLISGRVPKIPSANVRADRYEFLELSEAEPDLGLPSQLGQVFTSDLSGNRYWTRLDTANVTENGNLYFTNDRVTANVANLSIGTLFNVKLGANLSTGKALVYDSNVAAFVPVFVNSEVANVADLAIKVLSLENQSTANVREASSNLYFTNTRVLDAIAGADSINPLNVNVNGNLVIRGSAYGSNVLVNQITANSWVNLYSSNVIENTKLFFTNARVLVGITTGTVVGNISLTETLSANAIFANNAVIGSGTGGSITGANLISATFIQGNSWLGLYTANVVETAGNLYFTTARARQSVSNSTGVYYSTNTGVFSIGQDVAVTSDVQFRDMTLSGNLFILGNVAIIAANTLQINDPLIQVGVQNPGDQWDLGLVGHYLDAGERHAGLFRDASDSGKFKFFSNTLVEPGNVNYIDTTEASFRLSTVVVETLEGNVIGTVSSLSNHRTDALAEGNVNLYHTNARVIQTVTPLLTTANVIELTNLYFTNARVMANLEQMSVNVFTDVDLTGIAVNATLVWDGTKLVPGSTDVALRANFANTTGSANVALLSDVANTVLSLSNFTTANLAEGTNLYFTNTRTRAAFTPGKGIAITNGGVITNTGAPYEYNTGIDGSGYGNVSATMSPIITFPSTPTSDRFTLRSLHITNISDTDVSVSGNVLYATGNTAIIANRLPVPAGASFELLDLTQVFQPSDIVNLQGFNTAGEATANLLQAIYSYETFTGDVTYKGQGQTLATSNTNILIFDSTIAFSIIESIKFVNLTNSVVPVKLYWADANNVIKAHFAHNLALPSNSTMETIIKPKRISQGDRIFASYKNAGDNSISVFLSARTGYEYTLVEYTPNVAPTSTASISFKSSESDGTLIYYTIE